MSTIKMMMALLALLLVVVPTQAEEKNQGGFAPMFDGKTLEGWKTTGNWVYEEWGLLTLQPRPGEKPFPEPHWRIAVFHPNLQADHRKDKQDPFDKPERSAGEEPHTIYCSWSRVFRYPKRR